MKTALILSDHALINELYQFNFETYLNLLTFFCKDLKEFQSKIEGPQSFDVIILLSSLGKKNIFKSINDFCLSKEEELPIVFIGNSKPRDNDFVHFLMADFNFQKILKSLADILQITPINMAYLTTNDYYAIPMQVFKFIKEVPCNIYMKLGAGESAEYFVITQKGGSINIKDLKKKGVKLLYVEPNKRLMFIEEINTHSIGIVKNEIKLSKSGIQSSEMGFNLVASEIAKSPVTSKNIREISNLCIEEINKVTSKCDSVTKMLGMLINNQCGQLYKHNILTSYIAKHIINNSETGGDDQINKVLYCLFFHDIFLVDVFERTPHFTPEEYLYSSKDISDADKELIGDHARLAANVIAKWKGSPLGAENIILQHHGVPTGKGFTRKYPEEISQLAKVMIIAEDVCGMILKTQEQGGDRPVATKIIELLSLKYHLQSYTKLIQTLKTLTF